MPPAACLDPRLDQHIPLPMHPRDFQWTASLAIPALSNHHVLSTVRSWALEIPMSRYGMTPWTNLCTRTWGIDVITLQYVDIKWYKNTWVGLKVLVNVGNLTSWINSNVMRCQPRKPSRPGWSRPPYDCSVPLPVQGIQKGVFQVWKKTVYSFSRGLFQLSQFQDSLHATWNTKLRVPFKWWASSCNCKHSRSFMLTNNFSPQCNSSSQFQKKR